MNFGRRTPLEVPRPAVVPPTITVIFTDSGAPADFTGTSGVRGVESAPPPPPPHPAKNAAATAAANNLRNDFIFIRRRPKSKRAYAGRAGAWSQRMASHEARRPLL